MAELSTKLYRIRTKYVSDVSSVEEFVDSVAPVIERSVSRAEKIAQSFSAKDRAAAHKLVSLVESGHNGKVPKTFVLEPHEFSRKFERWLFGSLKPIKHESLFGAMVLTQLVSFQEAFLKDYLREVLSSRTEMLRSKKQITHEEICSHASLASLFQAIASSEVEELGRGSIDDFAMAYDKRLNVLFSDFTGWNELREASYRRNIVIHNQSRTNEIYCARTGHATRGQILRTDVRYVRRLARLTKQFVEFVHRKISRKFRIQGPTRR